MLSPPFQPIGLPTAVLSVCSPSFSWASLLMSCFSAFAPLTRFASCAAPLPQISPVSPAQVIVAVLLLPMPPMYLL